LAETGATEAGSPQLVNSPLLIAAVQYLTNEDVCDYAADVVCEVIIMCKRNHGGPFYQAVVGPMTAALLELTDVRVISVIAMLVCWW